MESYPKFDGRYRRKVEIIDLIIALVLVGFAIISLLNYNQINAGVMKGVGQYGFMGLSVIIIILEIIPSMLNPVLATWTAILSGYSLWPVLLVSVISSMFGSIIGFYLGKKYGIRYICFLIEEKTYDKVTRFWKKYGKLFVFISSFTPLPYIPLVFGSLRMNWKDFILWGVIPRILNFVVFGYLFYAGFWSL